MVLLRCGSAWQTISMSRNGKVIAVILGDPTMIDAYRAGIPARMAKIHWTPKPNEFFPEATVPGNLLNVDFMVKDSRRFPWQADTGARAMDTPASVDEATNALS